jgi:hypothetical protein
LNKNINSGWSVCHNRLAAMADVNQCQRMPQQSTEINVRGTEHVARLCALQRVMLALPVVVADTKVYDAPVVHGSPKSLWASCSKFRGSITVTAINDFQKRIRSYELLSEALAAA